MKKNHRVSHIKQTKVCPVCQLSFSNRKKWQRRGLWSDIVYCSQRCRSAPKK
ncbi:MAG: DUF2256 domain-containing protein [Pseudomonadales bacterium]|nr:DUF2256 domain-containing protein [Pseudomonadales bacterium]